MCGCIIMNEEMEITVPEDIDRDAMCVCVCVCVCLCMHAYVCTHVLACLLQKRLISAAWLAHVVY